MKVVISNPPYNMTWDIPILATMQERFSQTVVPPSRNANFAFVLTALNESDRCVFLLPCGVLTTNKAEKEIIKYLVEMNFIESIITCPDNMFENTGISTCIIVLDKNKDKSTIEMIDLRDKYEIEIREQKGQFGSKSHTNRTYKKQVKVLNDEIIDDVLNCIQERKTIKHYCICVSIKDVKEKDYKLLPSSYFDLDIDDLLPNNYHRDYKDIVNDLNRIIREKNNCKLTINETIAKNLGFDIELLKNDHIQDKELNELLLKLSGSKLEKHDYFTTTKKKSEIKFENNSKEQLSSIFMMIFEMWKQHIYYLNIEENRYLTELRDALLPELLSGKIDL